MLDIATLSDSLDTVAKLLRILEKVGVTAGQLAHPVNDEAARRNLAKYLAAGCPEFVQQHIIDCNTDPFLPTGWKVEKHCKGGQLDWDPANIQLWLSPNQQNGESITGNKLCKELEGKPVLNANVLDFLLAHPEFIPEEWKGKYIFFWGTIYRDAAGDLVVRYLIWIGGRWYWFCCWLGLAWGGGGPAALSVSI